MNAQKPIAIDYISDACVGQGGCWQYGSTSAAVFGSAGRFSKSQPPRRVAFSAPSSLSQRATGSLLHTGKEKDPLRLYLQSVELCRARLTSPPDLLTGYSYLPHQARQAHHGARYLEHELMAGWLSVDPMADKYPSLSPYAYCAWNPVRLVDPMGMDTIVSINIINGQIRMERSLEHDRGCVVRYYFGNRDKPYHETICEGEIIAYPITIKETNETVDVIAFSNDEDAQAVYNQIIDKERCGFSSDVEWNYYKNSYGVVSQLVTSHKRDEVSVTAFSQSEDFTIMFRHYHPNHSDLEFWRPSSADIRYARDLGIPCYLDYCGKSYRFDNLVPESISNPDRATIIHHIKKEHKYDPSCD